MSPEPRNTDGENGGGDASESLDMAVFMGSGLGLTGRPGMTKVISGQTLRMRGISDAMLINPSS
jgi:hypothetical protein